jgi:predicted DsbA family dithiol-disulfide isomerase
LGARARSGAEDRFFDRPPPRSTTAEILAAGRRAGLDAGALRTAIATGGVAPRLERDLRIAGSAGLEGLPTLDIGRRRLLGEQSEGELREAIVAALALRRDAR